MTKRELVQAKREEILALAEKYELTDVRLFGSVARGDEEAGSDVDIFVKRNPGSDAYLVFDFKDSMAALLECKVDVIVEQVLMKPRLRDRILKEAVAV